MLVHIVADYGQGDLAFAEVVQRIKLHLPDAEPVPTPVPPFSTLAAGFCVAQFGLNEAPPGTIVYLVRDAADELRWASVGAEGSQFRSRDLFPRAAAAIITGRPDALAGAMDLSDIPDVPHSRVAYADGYGNLKTTIKSEDLNLPSGSVARVGIGDVEREAYVSDGSFEVEEGKLALAPGSSGWTDAAGEETVWMELFLRGGSAWEEFGRPLVGSEVRIEA
jgi:hypothetical protein